MARKLPRLQRVLDAPALFSVAYGEVASSIYFALAALFLPHYVAGALKIDSLDRKPGDVIAGVCVILGIGLVRLARRSRLYRLALGVAFVDLGTQLLLVVLGFALLFSSNALTKGTTLGTTPSWPAIAFALPRAMLAFP